MKIIIDTNRIIAALIKNGISRKILFNRNFEFLTSSYSLSEIRNHEQEILKKTHISHSEFESLLSFIFERIRIVPINEYKKYMNRAKKFINDIDDAPFIALFLALKADGIWSDDKHFKEQKKLKIFRTKDLDVIL